MGIKISVELSHICPPDEIARHASACESGGFFRVWVPDTAVSPWEAWLAACVVMQNTSRTRIGLGVTNPYTRHPSVVAQTAATLQHLSGGRLAMSIGKGIGRFLEKAGIRTHPASVEEFIAVLRDLLAGNRTSFRGQVFRIDGIRLRTPPPREGVSLYLAAIGPESWQTALRVADGVATFFSEEALQLHRRAMAEREMPTAALVPFSPSREGFFSGGARSPDELRERAEALEQEGFDELIVGYGDLADLEAAAGLVGEMG